MKKQLKGCQIIVECLIEQGVEYVFGYPGGQIIDTFDALYERRGQIKQILTAHEQGAAHAADGYARVSGKPGVVIATSGPGATNLVTGIANAYMDSIPLIAITGNVPVPLLGRDSFQEVDIAGITMPITKHNYIVKDVNKLADTIREAFCIAMSGRRGPVLIDVPKDVQQALCDFAPVSPAACTAALDETQDFGGAAQIINSAARPYLFVGGGCVAAGASDELIALAEKLNAPVCSSVMGLGAFPSSHPLFAGLIGMHGSAAVAKTLSKCDLMIALGARFSDRVAQNRNAFMSGAKILHIDVDDAEIDKNVRSHSHIKGDVKAVLKKLLPIVAKQSNGDWAKAVKEQVEKHPFRPVGKTLCPRKVIEFVRSRVLDSTPIATDVGQHQMWVAQSYRFERGRTFVTSGGLGTMGFGMGAAIGAAFASKKGSVLFTGDGSFHMNLNELATAVKYGLDIKIFLFNNNVLGMVRQWQTLFYGGRYSSTVLNLPTDYEALAKAFGAQAFTLTRNEDIEKTVGAALKADGVVLVNCVIDEDDMVLPMIPPGKAMGDIIEEI